MSESMELMDVVKQTAFNVASISEQMGILSTEVKSIKIEQRRLAEGLAAANDRMQNYEDRIRLTRPQAQNIRSTIHKRAADLLGITYVNGTVSPESLFNDKYYRPGFMQARNAILRNVST